MDAQIDGYFYTVLDFVLFFTRYTPFWAVPVIFITVEFGYRYYLKRKKRVYMPCFVTAFFASVYILLYIYWGGPERSAKVMDNVLRVIFF